MFKANIENLKHSRFKEKVLVVHPTLTRGKNIKECLQVSFCRNRYNLLYGFNTVIVLSIIGMSSGNRVISYISQQLRVAFPGAD